MGNKKNPFKTIVSLNIKKNKALEHLMMKVPESDVIDGLREIREQLKQEKKTSHALTRIQKLLLDYPGFQKELLDTLTLLIREAKKNGTIDQYAAVKKAETKPKPKPKQKKVEATASQEVPPIQQKTEIMKMEPEPKVIEPEVVEPEVVEPEVAEPEVAEPEEVETKKTEPLDDEDINRSLLSEEEFTSRTMEIDMENLKSFLNNRDNE